MIKETTDMEAVTKIFNHPKVCGWIVDDTAIGPVILNPAHLYVMNEEGTAAAAVSPLTGSTCVVHFATIPEVWGKTLEIAREAIAWIFGNTRFVKIVGFTPECNRLAVRFGKRCGFRVEGRITKAFMKNWELHDMIVFGLSKHDAVKET